MTKNTLVLYCKLGNYQLNIYRGDKAIVPIMFPNAITCIFNLEQPSAQVNVMSISLATIILAVE
jgi:hypothetical protein